MTQNVERYPAVCRQLATGDRDHASGPNAQEVVPARIERHAFVPRQDTEPCKSGDNTLLTKHLPVEKLVRHSQEMGDVRRLRGHTRRISFVLLVGSAQEDRTLAGHGVEVVPTLQRDGDGCPPSLVGPEYHVDALAQAGDGPVARIFHPPDPVHPWTGGVDY